MYNGILTPDLSRLTLKVYTLPCWSAVGRLVLLQCTSTELKVQVGPRGNEGLGHSRIHTVDVTEERCGAHND